MTKEEMEKLLKLGEDGFLFHRESQNLEFKENFQFALLSDYAKTFAAFSNNQGGKIIFGISDSPRKPIGMSNSQFQNIDSAKITEFLNEYFSPEIIWKREDYKINEKFFGVISIEEDQNKPVICKKNNKTLKEGDIYYRYRGRSEKIKFPEIHKIFREKEEKEKKLWMEHIEQIAKIGPQNISFVDLVREEIPTRKGGNILIDKEIIKDLKIIKEGQFKEREGAPTLKLIGNIEGAETLILNLNLDDDFFTTKQVGEKLGWISEKGSVYFVSEIIKKFKIKEKKELCQHKGNLFFYSTKCLEFLNDLKEHYDLKDWKSVKKFLDSQK